MKDFVEKEGEAQNLVFDKIGQDTIGEVKKLQERIGLKDLDEVTDKLKMIVESSQEALRPETVDVVLHEVLSAVKQLKGEDVKPGAEDTTNQLDEMGSKIISGGNEESAAAPTKPAKGAKGTKAKLGPPPGESPPPAAKPAANPSPAAKPSANPPPGAKPAANPSPSMNPPPGGKKKK